MRVKTNVVESYTIYLKILKCNTKRLNKIEKMKNIMSMSGNKSFTFYVMFLY
jgi:hypothetical protein